MKLTLIGATFRKFGEKASPLCKSLPPPATFGFVGTDAVDRLVDRSEETSAHRVRFILQHHKSWHGGAN
ncbi:MAG: hypothetical protein ABJQ93_03150 [Luteolibacter sp.]